MKKLFKSQLLALTVTFTFLFGTFTSFASGEVVHGHLSGNLKLPTLTDAMQNGQAKRTILASQEESRVKPWVFVAVKLNSIRSREDKLNYSSLALNRAIAYFQDNKMHLKTNDYFLILNNGFVIDKDNYSKKEVYSQAKKTLEDHELYQGDTLFTIAFLSGEHRVIKRSQWKLIDLINLAPGSGHSSSTTFTTGINITDNITLSETLGFKLVDTLGGSFGIDKILKANVSGELTNEINKNTSRSFTTSNTVFENATETVTVKHGSKLRSTFVLRYQLVDNYNVNIGTFNSITQDLLDNMNMGGRDIVTLEPSCGLNGVEVPTNIIFDVMEQHKR